ncbi:MAG: biopolymer transporter ExbD [Aquabacterium sp.]|jgi:biopolymer transport protein ExbD|nr:MAG: biopolymer transporter ExbD [Aquabacterium sp.]
MKVQDDAKPYDTINVTPMLDLAYVLLVVFILMTTASVQGMPMSMPKPSAKAPTEKHEMHVLRIEPDGSLKLDGAPRTEQQMQADLATIKSRDAQASVVIQGDAKSQYARVVEMIDLCNEVEIGMSLATSRIGF